MAFKWDIVCFCTMIWRYIFEVKSWKSVRWMDKWKLKIIFKATVSLVSSLHLNLESSLLKYYSYEFCFRKKLSSLWTKKFHFHCKRNNFALVLATLSIYYAAQLTCICIKMCMGCACNFQSRKRPSCYWTSFLVISGSTFST